MFSERDLIYSYTRNEAIEDGVLVDIKPWLIEMDLPLSSWPTICISKVLFEDLVRTPAAVTFKQKLKYDFEKYKDKREESIEKSEKLRVKKIWARFIDMMLLNFQRREVGQWGFKYNDLSLLNATVVKALIHRDDNHNEVVTLMRDWED